MKTIWEYELQIVNTPQTLTMPKGARFCSTQLQHNNLCLWFLVDETKESEERAFRLIGTGHPLPESCKTFLGTIQIHYGQTVLHLFEEDKAEFVTSTNVVDFEGLRTYLPTGTA